MAAKNTESALKRESATIRVNLDNPNKYFVYTTEAGKSYEKEFKYVPGDLKLVNFAQDLTAVNSDCYLMYAIAVLGCTDLEGIRLFLSAYSNKNKDLSIPDMSKISSVRQRLRELTKNGMLFKHHYTVSALNPDGKVYEIDDDRDGEEVYDDEGRLISNKVTLYTISKSSQTLINKKLLRQTVIDEWIQARPLYELMGWAACGYVGGMLAQNKGYVDYIQGVFKTKVVGTTLIPGILKMQCPDGVAHVGIVPAFLHLDRSVKTEQLFEEDCVYKIKRMKQYLYSRDVREEIARLLVVVEDNSDLVQMASRIVESGFLEKDYDRVYFTGEGVMRLAKDTKFNQCFLQIKPDGSDKGFSYVPVKPDFLM